MSWMECFEDSWGTWRLVDLCDWTNSIRRWSFCTWDSLKGSKLSECAKDFLFSSELPPHLFFFFKETLTPFQRETLNDDFLWLVHTESMAQAGREKQRLFKGVKNRWFMNCKSMREVTSFESYSCDSLEMWSQNSQVLPPTAPVLSPCNPALSSFP